MADADALREAVRLFNARSYYQSHDVLEEEWADTRGPRREALKALVKLAAGMHHLQTGGLPGAESLLGSGLAGFEALPRERALVESGPLVGPVRRCLTKIRRLRAGEAVEWEAGDLPRFELPAP